MDPIARELIRYRLLNAASQMKSVVLHTAYSNLWKEAGDLSCALLTAHGEVIAQGGADIPIHLGTMPYSLRGLLAEIPAATLEPGDVMLQNDPYRGNNHLNDLFMVRPVFAEGRVMAYAAVRGHFADVGGGAPGSYTTTGVDLYAEGLRIPPSLIYRRGVENEDLRRMLEANLRHPVERLGDLHAQYAGCNVGTQRLEELAAEHGADAVEEAMEEILDASEASTRRRIEELPDGVWSFEDACDGDGIDDEPIVIAATVEISGSEISIDFSGSSPQCRGGMNMPLAVTTSAALFPIKCLTDPENPANSGYYRPITVTAPKGCVVNSTFPRPVVGGNHETAARVADAVFGALAEVLPDQVVAAGAGSTGIVAYGSSDGDHPFLLVEVHGAGQGAGRGADGGNAHRVNVVNTANTPTELLELSYPVHVERYAISDDHGGPGTWRGGCGIERRIRFEREGWLTITTDRAVRPPYGLFGGGPAHPTEVTLASAGGEERALPSKTAPLLVEPGSTLTISCAGGGGYGPPEGRALDALQADLDDAYVTPEAAERTYGRRVHQDPDRPDGAAVVS
ncbi:MAG: N-methylhydantoinase [Thermoleophilaceae bacterium]|jgi:N-methylhydantoinase B|nr:N-methylhydantoinase [Thermoleophilaceae bacterium]